MRRIPQLSISGRMLRAYRSGQLKAMNYQRCLAFHTGNVSNTNWHIGKINHIALVTPNLDKSAILYKDILKGRVSGKQPLPEHGVTTVFVELGDTNIEVDDIQAAVKDLKARNIRTLSEKPQIGAHGKPVIFLHPKDCDGVLVELEEA